MVRAFVSYSREDKETVKELIAYLEHRYPHIRFWHNPYMGGVLEEVLKNIEQADIFIYVISENFLGSPHLLFELKTAQDLEKLLLQINILPLIDKSLVSPLIHVSNAERPIILFKGNIEDIIFDLDRVFADLLQDVILRKNIHISRHIVAGHITKEILIREASIPNIISPRVISYIPWMIGLAISVLFVSILTLFFSGFFQPFLDRNQIPYTLTPSTVYSPSPDDLATSSASTEVSLLVINESGQKIGEGTFRLYASDTAIARGGSIRVELEVYFDSYYVTPTPIGNVTKIPARSPTLAGGLPAHTPNPVTPSNTPFYISIPEQVFYQRMGASLYCAENSFAGCVPKEAGIIGLDRHIWTWILSPEEVAKGLQNLHVTVWVLQRIGDGPEQETTIWENNFQLLVLVPEENATENFFGRNSDAIIGAISAVVVALIGLFSAIWVARRNQPSPSQADAEPSKDKKKR